MAGKQEILDSIRRHRLEAVPLIDPVTEGSTYPNLREQFQTVLTSVGGECRIATDRDDLNRQLADLPEYHAAATVCSTVPEVGRSDIDLNAINDPHELDNIDCAVLAGEFAIAENGAVWVTDRNVKHRVLYFIAEHLVLIVPASEIVDNMHAAYTRLMTEPDDDGHRFARPGFGTFLSGPSKTADIEQSLVMGAQGPKSLTVFLLE